MRHVLHLRAEASLPAIQAAMSHTRAKRIALVFPLGQPPAAASQGLFDTLGLHCRAFGTDVAIIGGDERLRAMAVASGFAVATTLDEWETASHPAVRPRRARPQPVDDEWEQSRLSLVGDGEEAAEESDLWDDEPPDYVIELMEAGGMYPGLRAVRSERLVERGLGDGQSGDGEEALRQAAEHYEASMTDAIRGTGGVLPSPSPPRKPDGESGSGGPDSI